MTVFSDRRRAQLQSLCESNFAPKPPKKPKVISRVSLQKALQKPISKPSIVGPDYEAGRFGYALANAQHARSSNAAAWKTALLRTMDELGVDKLKAHPARWNSMSGHFWWDDDSKPDEAQQRPFGSIKDAVVYTKGSKPVAVRQGSRIWGVEKTAKGWTDSGAL